MILNEVVVVVIGYREFIGKIIECCGEYYEIVGVVEDFYFELLYEVVKFCIIECSVNGR